MHAYARRGPWGLLALLGACGFDPPASVDTADPSSTAGSSGGASTGAGSVDDSTGGTSSAATGPAACDITPYEDDIVLEGAAATELSGDVARVAVLGEHVVGCGDGFVQPAGGAALAIEGRCTAVAALGAERGVVVTDAGATVLFSVADGAAIEVDAVVEADLRHEDVAARDGAVFVASGREGLRRFDAGPDALGPSSPVPGATDARGVAAAAEGLVVADGASGVRLVDPDGGGSLALLGLDPDVESPRLARGVVVNQSRAYVLRGAFGLSVVDLAADSLSLGATIATEGTALDAAAVDGGVLVATGSALVRYALPEGGEPRAVSRQVRPDYGALGGGWFRAVAAAGAEPLAAVGAAVVPVTLGGGDPQPHLDVDRATYSFWAEAGESTDSIVTLENRGAAPLVLAELAATPFEVEALNLDPRPGCPGQYVLEAGARGLVQLTYEDPAAPVQLGSFSAVTDASDTPTFTLRVEVNRPAPAVGRAAPPFAVLDSEGAIVNTSDFEQRVVFVKVFNET